MCSLALLPVAFLFMLLQPLKTFGRMQGRTLDYKYMKLLYCGRQLLLPSCL